MLHLARHTVVLHHALTLDYIPTNLRTRIISKGIGDTVCRLFKEFSISILVIEISLLETCLQLFATYQLLILRTSDQTVRKTFFPEISIKSNKKEKHVPHCLLYKHKTNIAISFTIIYCTVPPVQYSIYCTVPPVQYSIYCTVPPGQCNGSKH